MMSYEYQVLIIIILFLIYVNLIEPYSIPFTHYAPALSSPTNSSCRLFLSTILHPFILIPQLGHHSVYLQIPSIDDMLHHALVISATISFGFLIEQIGHLDALVLLQKVGLDVLLSSFECEHVLRLFERVGIGVALEVSYVVHLFSQEGFCVLKACLAFVDEVGLFERVLLDSTSTYFHSQSLTPYIPTLSSPSWFPFPHFLILFATITLYVP